MRHVNIFKDICSNNLDFPRLFPDFFRNFPDFSLKTFSPYFPVLQVSDHPEICIGETDLNMLKTVKNSTCTSTSPYD